MSKSENLAIVLGAYYSEIGIPTEFLVAVLAVHATGLLLMVPFCFLNHIIAPEFIPIMNSVFIKLKTTIRFFSTNTCTFGAPSSPAARAFPVPPHSK